MSGSRPAALDGSLLARKGAAVAAIPDESSLVLQLDEHRPEATSKPEAAPKEVVPPKKASTPKPVPVEATSPDPIPPKPVSPDSAGATSRPGMARAESPRRPTVATRSVKVGLLSRVSETPAKLRYAAMAGIAVVAIIVLWPASDSAEIAAPVVAETTPEPVVAAKTREPIAPVPSVTNTEAAAAPEILEPVQPLTPDLPEPVAAVPASVPVVKIVAGQPVEKPVPTNIVSESQGQVAAVPAPSISEGTIPAAAETADVVETVIVEDTATTATSRIFPVNVPPVDAQPQTGDLDNAPKLPGSVPKSVSPVPVPKAKPEISATPAGRYAVQLASIAVEKRATQEAFRLQKQLGQILGDHEVQVEKAVVAGKGTMYRVRAGGYQTYAEASEACAQLAQIKVSCLALRR